MPDTDTSNEISSNDRALAAIQAQIDAFRSELPALAELSRAIEQRVGSPLIDWVDSLHLVAEPRRRAAWIELGWLPSESGNAHEVLRYEGDELPPIVLHRGLTARLDLRVEDLDTFLKAHGLAFNARTEGQPGCALRRAQWKSQGLRAFGVVERHGTADFDPMAAPCNQPQKLAHWRGIFSNRRRVYRDELGGLEQLQQWLEQACAELGQGPAADLFLACEREYWQGRNQAALMQYHRQQGLGLGWGNYGKHIFRSSAANHQATIGLFRSIGFSYQADEYRNAAGMTQELAHTSIAARIVVEGGPATASKPKQAGAEYWTALHGESLFQAGMHRLCAIQYRARAGDCVGNGELWSVDPLRVRAMVDTGLLVESEAGELLKVGAQGSLLAARNS